MVDAEDLAIEEVCVSSALESHHATSLQDNDKKYKKMILSVKRAYFNVEAHARVLKRTSRGGMCSYPIHGIELTN